MLLQYIHFIFLPHDAIFFVKCTSPYCSKAKHTHNMILPPLCFMVGMVLFGLQASTFFLQTQRWPNSSIFVSSDQRTFLQKVQSLSPCAVANSSLAFFMAVLEHWLLPCWVAFQVTSIYDLFCCGYRLFCTGFLQHLHKVLFCCSGIDLHFSHWSTFIYKRQNVSPSWAVWRLRGPMVFILAYYCLYRWTWYLQAFGNCSQGWTRLVEVYNFWRLISFDFPMMSSRGTVWR